MLWKFLEEMKGGDAPTHLAVIFDKSEITFRNELYPQYKAHRPPAPEDLVPQFPLIRDATRAFNLPCIEMGGFEADDLIATYARQAARAGASVRIVSSDKDLMQLIVDGVIQLYDPMKNRALGPEAVMEKFGVGPDKVIDVQALIGDSTDNVPGAPGIGPKTAAELIAMFGSLDAILERANEVKQPKRRETLINFADQIRLSRQLVTLRTMWRSRRNGKTSRCASPNRPCCCNSSTRWNFARWRGACASTSPRRRASRSSPATPARRRHASAADDDIAAGPAARRDRKRVQARGL